jgi:ketosteroid isomerase-like protein
MATVRLLLVFPDRIERAVKLAHRLGASGRQPQRDPPLLRPECGSRGGLLGQYAIPAGHEWKVRSIMNTKEETTATTVRALTDAVNARDREATAALFATDGVFCPGAAGASFEGPEAIADALFGFLGAHKSGQFETAHEVFAGDEAYHEWKWAGVTNEGEPAEAHGCDYYLVRDGKVAVRSTFRKV